MGRFDVEHQIPMDEELPAQVLKYLEELGYRRARKDKI
jgi:hypothetical protein